MSAETTPKTALDEAALKAAIDAAWTICDAIVRRDEMAGIILAYEAAKPDAPARREEE